ncbi:MAG: hypothetical protein J5I94_05105 [Phaeodactylibacter sp.]|nr:hypothetical protein [Phaeodactylibacter sp.]
MKTAIVVLVVVVVASATVACDGPGSSEQAPSPAEQKAAADANRAVQAIAMAVEAIKQGEKVAHRKR